MRLQAAVHEFAVRQRGWQRGALREPLRAWRRICSDLGVAGSPDASAVLHELRERTGDPDRAA